MAAVVLGAGWLMEDMLLDSMDIPDNIWDLSDIPAHWVYLGECFLMAVPIELSCKCYRNSKSLFAGRFLPDSRP